MEKFKINDGGRSSYFDGTGGDCVTRAIAIVTQMDYMEVYNRLAEGNATQRKGKYEKRSKCGKRTALNGINVKRKWFKDLMAEWGFEWVPTMQIGQGCKVHLKADELPSGRIVCAVSKHYTAVIDGVLHDTYDCSRGGTRCVYGYWVFPSESTVMERVMDQLEKRSRNLARHIAAPIISEDKVKYFREQHAEVLSLINEIKE